MNAHEIQDKETEDFIKQKIKEFGWSVQYFEAEEEKPTFAYTIGLWETFKHPEIIVFGLSTNHLVTILNEAGSYIKEGKVLKVGKVYDEYLEGFGSIFRKVKKSRMPEYFGYGLWYYSGENFEAIQFFWPDSDGNFPWQEGFEESVKELQPQLF